MCWHLQEQNSLDTCLCLIYDREKIHMSKSTELGNEVVELFWETAIQTDFLESRRIGAVGDRNSNYLPGNKANR